MPIIIPPKVAIRQWCGIVSQNGTAAPEAIVLHNTLKGEIIWTRFQQGVFRGELEDAFGFEKTIILTNNTENGKRVNAYCNNASRIEVQHCLLVSPYTNSDNMGYTYIEIKVTTNE